MKQSAVEWLQEVLSLTFEQEMQFEGLFQQAKEMEKKQIIDAIDVTQRTDFYVKYEGSEQYYNETFKKK
jgi:hypothetical protein